MAKRKIEVQGIEVRIITQKKEDFICITDIAKTGKGQANDFIKTWLRNKNTLEFLATWETMHNPDFNSVSFHRIKHETGLNSVIYSAKEWITQTNAIGLQSKAGRYGGTYAHKDIAIQFATWFNASFYVFFIKEFQRLKEEETKAKGEILDWNVKRLMAKANYSLHTEAIKTHLIPPKVKGKHQGFIYANEADLLNVAVFGMTAKQWRIASPNTKGNLRDNATIEQLLVLANLESINARLIKLGFSNEERLDFLNETAIEQMEALLNNSSIEQLKKLE